MEGGPPGFTRDFSCPALLGERAPGDHAPFAYGAFTLFGGPFQAPSARHVVL